MEKKNPTLTEKVVGLFLNIFKAQEKVPLNTIAKFVPVTDSSLFGKGQIYELRIKLEEKWVKKRMAISPLGGKSGSRSTCFYVIFESHIVVKIPPESFAITDFNTYAKEIMAENRIAKTFSPRECIVSGVSVITKFFHKVHENGLDLETIENKHMNWLWGNSKYQKLLKIALQ